MPAPVTPPFDWATNANHSAPTEAWDGLPTKVAPSSGRQAAGLEPEDNPTAEELNALLNNFSEWIKYFQGIHASETKTVLIPAVAGVRSESGATRGWSPFNAGADYGHVMSVENGSQLFFDIGSSVPDGCTITDIDIVVEPGAARAGSNRCNMTLAVIAQATGAPGTHTTTRPFSPDFIYDNGTTTAQVVASDGALAEVVDKSAKIYTLMVQSGVDGGAHTPDLFKGVFVTYTTAAP